MKSRSLRLYLGLLALALCALGANAAPALALSPAVETLAATSIVEKGATLNGKVNPNGAETKIYFEYGTTTSYGSKTSEVSVGSGTTTLEKAEAISGLSANTTYHYRIVAANSSGTGLGADKTFTTTGPPTVSGGESSPEASGEAAVLKALIDPNGQSTTYQFEYGTNIFFLPFVVPIPAASVGSGFEPVAVEQKITGLTPGEQYFWRVNATNEGGSANGGQAFMSSKHPGISNVTVSNLSRSESNLAGTIKPNGSTSTYYFEYGATTSYGSKTATKEISSEVESKAVSETITGLKENTLFHYRLVASNAKGTHTGSDQTFTTPGPATLYPNGGSEPLKSGAPLKWLSTKVSFSGGSGSHSCKEGELEGILKENPGAFDSVYLLRLQTSLIQCEWKENYLIQYTMPGGFGITYSKDGSGSIVQGNKFTLVQTVYTTWFTKVGECEYNLSLAGVSAAGPIEATLSGSTELVKSSGTCPGAETVSGKFALTSEGTAVEAK